MTLLSERLQKKIGFDGLFNPQAYNDKPIFVCHLSLNYFKAIKKFATSKGISVTHLIRADYDLGGQIILLLINI